MPRHFFDDVRLRDVLLTLGFGYLVLASYAFVAVFILSSFAHAGVGHQPVWDALYFITVGLFGLNV